MTCFADGDTMMILFDNYRWPQRSRI